MGTTFSRRLLLGVVIASSLGIGYAIGAQPHMTGTISLLQSARSLTRRRPTRAAIANARLA